MAQIYNLILPATEHTMFIGYYIWSLLYFLFILSRFIEQETQP